MIRRNAGAMSPLRFAFLANILILVPVCWSMFVGRGVASVFEGVVTDSAGLRLLVGSFWMAILLGSVAGLFNPRAFAVILLLQVTYKALWLGTFVLPRWQAGDPIPIGISLIFLAIVLTYPLLYWAGTRS